MSGLSAPDLCKDCNIGEHATCDFTLRRKAGLCGCTSSRHGRRSTRPSWTWARLVVHAVLLALISANVALYFAGAAWWQAAGAGVLTGVAVVTLAIGNSTAARS